MNRFESFFVFKKILSEQDCTDLYGHLILIALVLSKYFSKYSSMDAARQEYHKGLHRYCISTDSCHTDFWPSTTPALQFTEGTLSEFSGSKSVHVPNLSSNTLLDKSLSSKYFKTKIGTSGCVVGHFSDFCSNGPEVS